jgi:hypothetical protein
LEKNTGKHQSTGKGKTTNCFFFGGMVYSKPKDMPWISLEG